MQCLTGPLVTNCGTPWSMLRTEYPQEISYTQCIFDISRYLLSKEMYGMGCLCEFIVWAKFDFLPSIFCSKSCPKYSTAINRVFGTCFMGTKWSRLASLDGQAKLCWYLNDLLKIKWIVSVVQNRLENALNHTCFFMIMMNEIPIDNNDYG